MLVAVTWYASRFVLASSWRSSAVQFARLAFPLLPPSSSSDHLSFRLFGSCPRTNEPRAPLS
uniref:Uncharacterized protein n=1 Tax=Setaria italica TaxID=4555 RepID=K3YFJ1_SETIT